MKGELFVRFTRLIGSGVAFSALACSSLSLQPNDFSHSPLNLDTADRIRVGTTRVDEIQRMLGTPRIKLPGDDPATEAWLYCDREKCSQPRLTLYVDLHTDTVMSVNVALRDGDSERDLIRARGRYPGTDLRLQRYLYSYRDYFETVESYVDSKQGLVIGYDEAAKKVAGISRGIPPLKEPQATQSASGYPQISKLPERETASEQ